MIESLEAKEIIAIAAPFIKATVDTFVTPTLEKLKTKAGITIHKNIIPTESNFTEYFSRTYKRIAIINTLVFNNSKKELKKIYIPLTLNEPDEDNPKKHKITGFPDELIESYSKVLVVDSAGMGKSTIMKIMFMDIIDRQLGIPILIELRRLKKGKTLVKEILEQLSAINKSFREDLLLEFIKLGKFIFILDGYDEITLSERESVTEDIINFIGKSPDNKYILTSRPESALSGFGDFFKFYIEPLTKKEAYELIKKYDEIGTVSELLISKLEEANMNSIEEFLTNPLLVSLLYTAFDYKQVIPFKKHLFYRQVYDANFETHDLTKGDSYMHDKYTKLDIDDFHRVLRVVGFASLKEQKIEFSKDEILKIINEAKKFCVGLDFSSSDFLKDILITVPIFSQDGVYYRWAHKSLQEYFAAQFIYLDSKEQQSKILNKIYENNELEKFINILDIYYDIDYRSFRNVIIYNILKDYRHYISLNYNSKFRGVSDNNVVMRREVAFYTKSFIFRSDERKNTEAFNKSHLQKMMEQGSSFHTSDNCQFEGIVVHPKKPDNIFLIHTVDKKNQLLSIIDNKRNPIVSHYRSNHSAMESIVLDNIHLDTLYTLYPITDRIDEPLNSPLNFSKVTSLIKMSTLGNIKINESIALKLIKDIEADLKVENKDDFLLNGF